MKIQSVLVSSGVIIIAIVIITGGIKRYNKETPPNKANEIITQPKDTAAEVERKLGPGWKKTFLNPGQSHGPVKMRNRSSWEIGSGQITVQINKKAPFKYSQGDRVMVSGSKIRFFNSSEKEVVLFFKY